jgi:hypothetical protein
MPGCDRRLIFPDRGNGGQNRPIATKTTDRRSAQNTNYFVLDGELVVIDWTRVALLQQPF